MSKYVYTKDGKIVARVVQQVFLERIAYVAVDATASDLEAAAVELAKTLPANKFLTVEEPVIVSYSANAEYPFLKECISRIGEDSDTQVEIDFGTCQG